VTASSPTAPLLNAEQFFDRRGRRMRVDEVPAQ
jgi:hypothetical protein